MGNHSCYLLGQDCFSSCFSSRYFSWKNATNNHSDLQNPDEYPSASVRDIIRRNRISEYIAQALSRSRSPLLLHDDFLPSDNSPLDPDFPANNTSSWMSDATRSDASHRLYREVDPSYTRQHRFTGMTDSGGHLVTPTSGDEDYDDEEEEEKDRHASAGGQEEVGGGWVAVARLSACGSHKRTLTSAMYLPSSSSLTRAVPPLPPIRRPRPSGQTHPLEPVRQTLAQGEEEVDSLELARVSRDLWTVGDQRFLGSAEKNRTRQPLARPTVLNLSKRSGPGVGQRQGPSQYRQPHNLLQQTSLDPSVLNSDEDSPAELDWDHEPGTSSVGAHLSTRSGVRKSRVYLSGSFLSESTLNDANVFESEEQDSADHVHRRPPLGLATTGAVSGWPSKDRTTGPCSRFPADRVDVSAVGLSAAQTVTETKGTNDLPDELVDSGFVGLTNSTSGGDADCDGPLGLVVR